MNKLRNLSRILIWKILLMTVMALSVCAAPAAEEDNEMLEKTYRQLLGRYLAEKLDLKKYDDMLAGSDAGFIPVDEENMSKAQINGQMGLKYIYLRNPLHMERLSEAETEAIIKAAAGQGDDEPLSEDSLKITESTMLKVISHKEIKTPEDREVLTCYDSTLEQDFVTVDTVVLKIASMPEYDADGNYKDRDHEFEKTQLLTDFALKMEEELGGRLGDMPIRIMID